MKKVNVTYALLYDETHEKLLMVKNKGKNGSYYTLPGGAVKFGETLEEAAIREVKEETGLDISVKGVCSISEAFFEERGHHAIFFNFLGEIIGGKICISRPKEIEEITWMELDSAEPYLRIPEHLKSLLQKKETVPYIFNGTIIHQSS
ncbi:MULTISPECIES: NUDIX hydrolase [Bacillus]|uniref:NUDIX hydrolase n=1 Tax=Bacillus TaxID=1386 RepID=UPI00099301E0|nr:NUDIX hydrolase [Bacillus cereus]MBJ7985907.1 NUDIX hydrolase [Bacillus cereus]OOQ95315.1 DNA mismatch repair protein MutT [Bacillus cereus]